MGRQNSIVTGINDCHGMPGFRCSSRNVGVTSLTSPLTVSLAKNAFAEIALRSNVFHSGDAGFRVAGSPERALRGLKARTSVDSRAARVSLTFEPGPCVRRANSDARARTATITFSLRPAARVNIKAVGRTS